MGPATAEVMACRSGVMLALRSRLAPTFLLRGE